MLCQKGGKLELNEEDYIRELATDEGVEIEDLIGPAPSQPVPPTEQTSSRTPPPPVWSPLSTGCEESSIGQPIDLYAHQADIVQSSAVAQARSMYPAMQVGSASNAFMENLLSAASLSAGSQTLSNVPSLDVAGGAMSPTITQYMPVSLGQFASLQNFQTDQYSMMLSQQQQFRHQQAHCWNSQIAPNASSLATPSNVAVQSSPHHSVITKPQTQQKETVKKKSSRSSKHPGRTGDQRMNKAMQAKLNNADISLIDALLSGGFVFPDLGKNDKKIKTADVKDLEGVSIYQRRNQLLRRLRLAKDKEKKSMLAGN